MTKVSASDLVACFDTDLVSWLMLTGHQPLDVTLEGGRVAFLYPKTLVTEKQQEISAGKAVSDIRVFSNTVRSLHLNHLSPSAKLALRTRLSKEAELAESE